MKPKQPATSRARTARAEPPRVGISTTPREGGIASDRIPVAGVRHVRVWGLQVDDERELPGLERTQIPDEELWEVNLVGKNGSKYEFDSTLLKPAPE